MSRLEHLTDVKSKDPPGPHSKDSNPINATRARRYLTLAAVKLLGRVGRRKGGRVLILSRRFCVKYGSRVDLSEAAAMQFVREKTSVPVPKIHCAFTRGEMTYIVMEHMDGDMLAWGWVLRSEESKAKICLQLKEYVREMRRIPPPGLGVSNVDGGSLFEPRIAVPTWRFGPYTSIHAFHEFLHEGRKVDEGWNADAKRFPEVSDLIHRHEGPWPPPVFTHGDLSSLNILAKGDRVVGIVDWETAGWFPSYWEYTTAYQVNHRNPFWIHEIDKFLDPFPAEQAMELVRQKYFGDF